MPKAPQVCTQMLLYTEPGSQELHTIVLGTLIYKGGKHKGSFRFCECERTLEAMTICAYRGPILSFTQ